MTDWTGHGPVANAIYEALSGSFGDFGADHAKKAADAVKRVLTDDTTKHKAALELERHLPEQSYEAGCRFACGYDGSDLDVHLAANVLRSVAEKL